MAFSRFSQDASATEAAARRLRERKEQVAQGKTIANDLGFLIGWVVHMPWRVTLWLLKRESERRR